MGHQHALVVKRGHEAPEVFVIRVHVDHHGGLTRRVFGFVGVITRRFVASAQHIVGIGQQGVGATGDDDVHIFQTLGQGFFNRQGLHVGQQHHFVDACCGHLVHAFLNDRCQAGHIHLAAGQSGHELQFAGRGDVRKNGRTRADHANFLAADVHHGPAGQFARLLRRLAPVGQLQTGHIAVGSEVHVVGQIRKACARPGATGADHVDKLPGAQIQFVVANGRSLHAHRIQESNVSTAYFSHTQCGIQAAVIGGIETRPRDVVVTRAHGQGLLGVLGAKLLDHPRQIGHAVERRAVRSVGVGDVQQLQREGGFGRIRGAATGAEHQGGGQHGGP